ncbi:MAG: DUF58 domain-containing protein [Oscillospiraceae bacterium]|nr:DUF58 domain-containing protein [Oscillospiraceae bacterium]
MIAYYIVCLAAIILALQFAVAPKTARHLTLHYSLDAQLAEPGEKIAFFGSLANHWFLPVSFINYYAYLPKGAVISGKEINWEAHSLFLLPHRSYRHTVLFTLPKRGVYRSGKYYVETGDFLGFKSWVTSREIPFGITVMPKLCTDEPVLKILGDYIGDISVRRFIMEDPVLTLGYLDYTGREPMKKIAWKQSAKVGRLMVKNNDYTVDANAAVVLNMASGSPEEKEKCLEIVRTVCERLEKEQIPYQFLSNGDAGNLREGFGKKHFDHLMTNLGRSALFSYSSFDSLIERCIRERKRSLSHFIISAPLTAQDRDALVRLQRYSEYELCVLEAEVNRDAAC